jgi:hypothetical protein
MYQLFNAFKNYLYIYIIEERELIVSWFNSE